MAPAALYLNGARVDAQRHREHRILHPRHRPIQRALRPRRHPAQRPAEAHALVLALARRLEGALG